MNKIPNILHVIWVGDVTPPNYFYENLASWKQFMPDWEFKVWTNEEIKADIIDLSYLELLNKTRNGAQKTDLLRYYVVNKFGGYYVDADIKPERSLLELNAENNDFVICHDLEITWEYIMCAFFAATANNPILQYAIEQMYNVDYSNKEQHLTTGPGALGRAYFAEKQKVNSLILPYWYFYRNKKGSQHLDGTAVLEDIPGAFGSHQYAQTWVTTE